MDRQRFGADPKHAGVRNALRVIGPLVLVAGVGLVLLGIAGFFQTVGSHSLGLEPPKFMLFFFLGAPLVVLGGSLTSMGFMGAVARYQAQEMAPVGKDTFNYLAKGTEEGVEAIGRGLARGLASGDGDETSSVCGTCSTENYADARFCDNCGASLKTSEVCGACGNENDLDARFCDHCGAGLR